MSRVVLHIDRVVLDGFGPAERAALVEGLREGLTQHYSGRNATEHLRGRSGVERMNAGSVRVASGTDSRFVGQAAARNIARGLNR